MIKQPSSVGMELRNLARSLESIAKELELFSADEDSWQSVEECRHVINRIRNCEHILNDNKISVDDAKRDLMKQREKTG